MSQAVVIGAGPAGLMAADRLAGAGHDVILCEGKPSVGRKFLMAGKSGLNLSRDSAFQPFLDGFAEAAPMLHPILSAFDNRAVRDWAEELGQPMFTGSTGRVFPKAMKASPLLRAWLARLRELGVETRTGWRWQGWQAGALRFETPQGGQWQQADVVILALGGASWPRLGSDGAWTHILEERGINLVPFSPANVGVSVPWSSHIAHHFGAALKSVQWQSGTHSARGEAVISAHGLEGGGVYAVSRGVREGQGLTVDLRPDLTLDAVTDRLSKPQGKTSLSNHLRKTLRLDPLKIALLQELARPLPSNAPQLAQLIKSLPISAAAPMPLEGAISVAGGIAWDSVDANLMLRSLPGVFVAGEMLDWEAPTGGYLLPACLATGRWAGEAAANWLTAGIS